MNATAWPTVHLGAVLRRSECIIPLDPEATYKEVTVRINGKGVVERRKVRGIEIASNRRYRAKAGQFIISRIDARHGASGLIPAELDGAIVTNDFPLFDVAEDRLDPAFLSWMSKTASFIELCKRASEGTTNRVRLSEDRFKALEVPLPPLDEQRRIVARIEDLAAKVQEACGLRSILQGECNLLHKLAVANSLACGTSTQSTLDLPDFGAATRRGVEIPTKLNDVAATWQIPRGWRVISIAELLLRGALLDVKDGNHGSNHPKSSEFSDHGTPFLMARDIQNGRVNWESAAHLPLTAQGNLKVGSSKYGDVLFTHKASIGKVAITDRDSILSPQVTYYRCNFNYVEPRWLKAFLGSKLFLDQLADVQMQSTRDFVPITKQYRQFVLMPPLAIQKEIAEQVDALDSRFDRLQALQAEAAAELDALLPAILDKGFKGELVRGRTNAAMAKTGTKNSSALGNSAAIMPVGRY